MATILVVDDDPTNRELLMTLLGYVNHHMLEATDGADGLNMARTEYPDLIITDLLMPGMDGFEFVRQLRADPHIAQTPVIFYTASYLQSEARALAAQCGVSQIIVKPVEPEVVLSTVSAALGMQPPPLPVLGEAFHQQHLQVLAAKLSQKLDVVIPRLAAMIELGQQLVSEADPQQLLKRFCLASREIIGAKYSAVGILAADGHSLAQFIVGGISPEQTSRIGTWPTNHGLLSRLGTANVPFRIADVGTHPQAIGFPPGHPTMRSFLGMPIRSATKRYGWLYLTDKIDEDEFSEDDEQLVAALTAQMAVAYDNVRLVTELRGYAGELEQRVEERTREIHQAKEQIEAVVNHSSDAILVVRSDGAIEQINPTFSQLFGYDAANVIGQSLLLLAQPKHADQLASTLVSIATNGSSQRIEIEACRRDGTTFDADIGLSPIFAVGGAASSPGVVCSIRDITDRKRVERELQALNQLKTEFLSTAAHELRTPLTSILGFSELLVNREMDAARSKHLMKIIHDQSRHLRSIIDSLLDISRLESKRSLALDIQPVYMADLIVEALIPFVESSPKHHFQVEELSAWPASPGDPARLNQVMQNLLSNAVRFSPEGATVKITGQVLPGFVQINIEDEGIGMTPQQQTHLFERFYRADASNTTLSGTGMGLAICKLIIELHGGLIWVQSEAGVGTAVHFTLPLSTQEAGEKE